PACRACATARDAYPIEAPAGLVVLGSFALGREGEPAMNARVGAISAAIMAAMTALFAASLIADTGAVSYGASLILSAAYLTFACALASEAEPERASAAYAGIALGA